MFHTTFVQIARFNWLTGRHKGYLFEKYSNFFSKIVRRMKLKLSILTKDIALYKSYVFYSGRIRTLVAMATYSFNRLIMGKVEIGNFYCLIVDNRILFLQKSLLNSSPLL